MLEKKVRIDEDVLVDIIAMAGNHLLDAERSLECCYSLARIIGADEPMDLGDLIKRVRFDIENLRHIFLEVNGNE